MTGATARVIARSAHVAAIDLSRLPAERRRVYFVRSGNNGPIKIGCSLAPAVRLRELQREHDQPLHYIGSITGGFDVERALHRRFADLRISGEWFSPGADLIAFISEALAHDSAADHP